MNMPKKIAVLGAGHGGCVTSADLTLYGNKVNLWESPKFESNLKAISNAGGIEIFGSAKTGFAKLQKTTTDIKEAIEDVDVIISTVVANAHRQIAEATAPYLTDEQCVMLWGKGGGSMIFRKAMQDKGSRAKVLLGETNSLPYGARRREGNRVEALSPLKSGTLLVGFPAKDTPRLIEVVHQLYPDRPQFFAPGENVLESMMCDYNAVTHPAVTLCNAGRIEFAKGEFPHWAEGYTPSVAKLEDALENERLALVRAMGLTGKSTERISSSFWLGPGGLLSTIKAPPNLEVRYITEDVPCGLVTFSSLGRQLGVETPVIDSLISVFSALAGRNLAGAEAGARTTEQLGLAGMNPGQMRQFATEGIADLKVHS